MSKYVSDETRRILSEELEDYDPPSDEELEAWLEDAGPPFPEEWDEEEEATPTTDGGDAYDPSDEFADDDE